MTYPAPPALEAAALAWFRAEEWFGRAMLRYVDAWDLPEEQAAHDDYWSAWEASRAAWARMRAALPDRRHTYVAHGRLVGYVGRENRRQEVPFSYFERQWIKAASSTGAD